MSESASTARPRPGIDAQRDAIRAAAIDLLARYGSKAVSVSKICKAADISRDTYYRCFASKDALIDDLYANAVRAHIDAVMNAWDMDYGNRAWLRGVCSDTIDAIIAQHKIACLLFVEAGDRDSPAYRVIDDTYRRAATRMQRWCRDTGREVPEREYLQSLLVAAQWLVHDAINAGMSARAVAKAKSATERLFYAAFAAL